MKRRRRENAGGPTLDIGPSAQFHLSLDPIHGSPPTFAKALSKVQLLSCMGAFLVGLMIAAASLFG
jgi:hypothetical protein